MDYGSKEELDSVSRSNVCLGPSRVKMVMTFEDTASSLRYKWMPLLVPVQVLEARNNESIEISFGCIG